jgi:hypothetical protein
MICLVLEADHQETPADGPGTTETSFAAHPVCWVRPRFFLILRPAVFADAKLRNKVVPCVWRREVLELSHSLGLGRIPLTLTQYSFNF